MEALIRLRRVAKELRKPEKMNLAREWLVQRKKRLRPSRSKVPSMDILSLDEITLYFKVRKRCLQIQTSGETLTFDPLKFPYKMIVFQTLGGYISIDALEWLSRHNVSLLKTGYGNQCAILPQDFSTHARLRLAQFRAYENLETRLKIARAIVENKMGVSFADCKTQREILMKEAVLDRLKWIRLKREVFDKTEFKFETRSSMRNRKTQNADNEINALLNYSFSILESMVRKAVLSAGLEPSIGFLHLVKDRHEALVYDLQEAFRIVCEDVVCRIVNEVKTKDFYRSAVDYHFLFRDNVRKLLLSRLKEAFERRIVFEGQRVKIEGLVYLSAYNLASYLLGKKRQLELPVLRKHFL